MKRKDLYSCSISLFCFIPLLLYVNRIFPVTFTFLSFLCFPHGESTTKQSIESSDYRSLISADQSATIPTPLKRATRRASLRSSASSERRNRQPQTIFKPAEANTISPQTSPTMGGTECQDGTGANSPSGEKKSVTSCTPP